MTLQSDDPNAQSGPASPNKPSTYVLIPGAGGTAWYWHLVVPLLEQAGHNAIAVDLPGDDEKAGLPDYARLVAAEIGKAGGRGTAGERGHVSDVGVGVVAQSLGGFTAPLVGGARPVRAVVLVNAMIPVPGETAGAWWGNTGSIQARTAAAEAGGYSTEFDEFAYFLHDVPADVAEAGLPYQRPEADAVFGSVCDFTAWPPVPIRAVAGADDRFFPVEFQQKLASDRLGIEADVLPGGHLIALSQPRALADYLLAV